MSVFFGGNGENESAIIDDRLIVVPVILSERYGTTLFGFYAASTSLPARPPSAKYPSLPSILCPT
jgi:hypothetical protein